MAFQLVKIFFRSECLTQKHHILRTLLKAIATSEYAANEYIACSIILNEDNPNPMNKKSIKTNIVNNTL